jgi:hypothetical protein
LNSAGESNEPNVVGFDAITRISNKLGQKTVLDCTSDVIKKAIKDERWQYQAMGYSILGIISESCK